MNNIRKSLHTSWSDPQSGSALSAAQKNIQTTLSSALDWRIPFSTLSTEAEIASLQKGKIPTEVLYSGEAGRKLSAIDNQGLHPYTVMVNNGFSNMFISHAAEFTYYEHLQNCLGKIQERVDIWTGNGKVSNMVALTVHNAISQAKMKRMMDAIEQWNYNDLPSTEKTKFISCDLSKTSLQLAQDLATDHFHDLEKLFDLSYYHGTFQKLLTEKKSTAPRLITMFNVLANFEYTDLKKLLQEVADSMKSGDIFIPSFFAMHDKSKEMSLGSSFGDTTKHLYFNRETADRCTSAFAERYKVDPRLIKYNVERKNDGRDYIDVSLHIPKETSLHIPTHTNEDESMSSETSSFEVFKSYRMTKQEITKLYESVGLKIDNKLWLGDREGIHFAPVLYKP